MPVNRTAIRKVSVILPCYNGASTLQLQLDALARQQWAGEWEVLFVDNGSTDASADMVELYRGKLPGLRIIQASSPGKPMGQVDHSYRVGLAAAQGDAFLFCEADDEVGDNWLPVMVEALNREDFVACAIDYQRLNPAELVWGDDGQQSRASGGLPTIAGPLYLPFATGCGIGFTRALWEKVGDPSADVGPAWDTEYSWRVQLAGYKLAFVPETVVHYRVRQGAKARFRQARSYGQGSTILRRKWGEPRPIKFLLYCAKRFAKTSGALAVGVALRRRPFAYYVWDIGFLVGQLDRFPELLRPPHAGPPSQPMAGAA